MGNDTTKVSSSSQSSRRFNAFQLNTFNLPLLILILSACTASQQIKDPNIAENAPEDCSFQTTNFDLYNTVEQMSPNAMASWPTVKSRFKSGLPEKNSLFVTTNLVDTRGHLEYVFVAVDRISAGRIFGRVWSQINAVEGYEFGDNLTIDEKEAKDWLITKPDGSEEGNLIGKYMDTLERCEKHQH